MTRADRIGLALGLVLFGGASWVGWCLAESLELEEARALRRHLADPADDRWIYDDLDRGLKQAARADRPLLVSFRCTPSPTLRTLDACVALAATDELSGLLDSYVLVRKVQMWDVDLTRFAFDGSSSWTVLLMHSDGTIYGRYAAHAADAPEVALAGFTQTLRAGLELHRAYEAEPETWEPRLAGKRAEAKEWAHAQEIPHLAKADPRRFTPECAPDTCLRCHETPVAEFASLRDRAKPASDQWFWPFPAPSSLGLVIDPTTCSTVADVAVDSLASHAGLRRGDRLTSVDGQPILSAADVSWALHHLEAPTVLTLEAEREGTAFTTTMPLPQTWRRDLVAPTRRNLDLQEEMLGVALAPLGPPQRRALGLGEGLALRVERVTERWLGALSLGALVVGVDGRRDHTTLGELSAYLLSERPQDEPLRLTILEEGEETAITLPVDETTSTQ